MSERLRDPDGVVHARSPREKYPSPAFRETVCEHVDRATYWKGSWLTPTSDATTCITCLGART